MPVAASWSVVLPIKGGARAKTRLAASPALALALSLDCLDAVTSCPLVRRVVVVTGDDQVGLAVRRAAAVRRVPAVRVVTERRPGAGLVPAVRDGVAALRGGPGAVAVLLADLPALLPDDLGTALDAAGSALAAGAAMVVVPDAEAQGTVLLAASRAADLTPAFGPHSLAAHHRLGATVLDLDLPRLRRDVDTRAELEDAVRLGVGRRTAQAIERELRAAASGS